MSGDPGFIRADAAWVSGRELRHDVAIALRGGIIDDIIPASAIPADAVIILDAKLLLPGFINAHCHLEYSSCRRKLPRGRIPFPQWVERLSAVTRGTPIDEQLTAAREGIREMLAGGTTMVVDCIRSDALAGVYHESPMRHLLLWEMIGLTQDSAEKILDETRRHVEAARPCERCLPGGINPHAPYTVGPLLRQRTREWLASNPELACGWHLNETSDEMELFADGSGAWMDLFGTMGLPPPFDETPRTSPTAFLEREGLLDRCDLAFHLNYPDEADLARFAAPRCVVHCPGTHQYFERDPFPMADLLNAGANVCLGTDSLASADTLSMLDAIRIAADEFPFLSGSQLIGLATSAPARSRVLPATGKRFGVIDRGAVADFAALATDHQLSGDLRHLLIAPGTFVEATIIAGERVY